MKQGDKVEVINGSLKSFGKIGFVEHVDVVTSSVAVKFVEDSNGNSTKRVIYKDSSLKVIKPNDFNEGDHIFVSNKELQSFGREGVVVKQLDDTKVIVILNGYPKALTYYTYNLKKLVNHTANMVVMHGKSPVVVVKSQGRKAYCVNPKTGEYKWLGLDVLAVTGKGFNSSLKVGGKARVIRGKTLKFNHVGDIIDVDVIEGTVTLSFPYIGGGVSVFSYTDVCSNITIRARNTFKYGDEVVITKQKSPNYGKHAVVKHVNTTTVKVAMKNALSNGYLEVFSDTNLSLIPDNMKHSQPVETDSLTLVSGVLLSSKTNNVGSAIFNKMFTADSRESLDQSIIERMKENEALFHWVIFINCEDVNQSGPTPVKLTTKLEIIRD